MKKIMLVIVLMVLVTGCNGGDKDQYKETLLNDHYLEYTEENFFTAVLLNNYEVVELFLKAGMDPDSTDIINQRIMYSAIGRDCVETIGLLFEYGAEPNYINEYEVNYLYFAGVNGQSCETITALVDGGVDLNYVMPNGETVLDSVEGQYRDDYLDQIKCFNDFGLSK